MFCMKYFTLVLLQVGIIQKLFVEGGKTCTEFSCDFGASCKPDKLGRLSCICPDFPCDDGLIHTALCGDDGFTYSSPCALRLHICKSQTWVGVKHIGKCGAQKCESKWECLHGGNCVRGVCKCVPCRAVMERRVYHVGADEGLVHRGAIRGTAVCGTDGHTYESECHLRYHACVGRTSISMVKRGVCRRERSSHYRSKSALPSRDIIDFQPLTSPRSLTSHLRHNCTIVKFEHCVSRFHSRLKFMGTFKKQTDLENVYKLIKYGTVPSSSHQRSYDVHSAIYLHPFTTSRPNSTGGWMVGSDSESAKGWLGVADGARLPKDVRSAWKSTKMGRHPGWVEEPTLKVVCEGSKVVGKDCADAFSFKGIYAPNRLPVLPATPIYTLKLREVFRRKNKKRQARRVIFVEIETTMKLKRFRSYILKIANERTSCGLPTLLGTKSQRKHEMKCEGAVVINTNIMKKMMKAKVRLLAPPYGCISVSASVLSAKGRHYSDDTLVQTTCPESQ